MAVCEQRGILNGVQVFVLCCVILSGMAAAQQYQAATLVGIQKRVEMTPQTWLWNTPVTFVNTAHYEMTIRVGEETYLAEYTPLVQPDGVVPTEWKPDSSLEVRVEKHRILIRLSGGEEVETRIVRKLRTSLELRQPCTLASGKIVAGRQG